MEHKKLTNYYLKDQLSDIRTSRRYQITHPQYLQNNLENEKQAIAEFRRVWKSRHNATIGKWGVPNREEVG